MEYITLTASVIYIRRQVSMFRVRLILACNWPGLGSEPGRTGPDFRLHPD